MNWSSFLMVHRIKAKLRGGEVVCDWYHTFRATGRLETPAVLAKVVVLVPRDFQAVLTRPPRVWCREPWMRSEPDWHNDAEDGMCWVLENEWRDVLDQCGRNEGELVRIASDWLIHNVTSLVSRHYFGHLRGLRNWPAEWSAWKHYDKGVAQYEREQDQQS